MTNTFLLSQIDQYVIDFVRQLRIDRGLHQHDLAGMLDTGRNFITNVEHPRHRAKYNLRHINTLAWFLDLSLHDFLPPEPFHIDGPHILHREIILP